jgi:putative exporter of polyketide antibiotics
LDGSTPEEIIQQFDTLELADIYTVVGYYLHHRQEVDAYLAQQRLEAEEVQKMIEAKFNPVGIRERLLARKKQSLRGYEI